MTAIWVAIGWLVFLFGWLLGYVMRVQERLDKVLAEREEQLKKRAQQWTAFASTGDRKKFEQTIRSR